MLKQLFLLFFLQSFHVTKIYGINSLLQPDKNLTVQFTDAIVKIINIFYRLSSISINRAGISAYHSDLIDTTLKQLQPTVAVTIENESIFKRTDHRANNLFFIDDLKSFR